MEGFEWLRTWASYSRVTARAYEKLFSVSATLNSTAKYAAEITEIRQALERWKDAIPEHFRPGHPIRPNRLGKPWFVALAVRIHFLYCNMLVALSRLAIHVFGDGNSQHQSDHKITLMRAARSIIETTQFVHFDTFNKAWWVIFSDSV